MPTFADNEIAALTRDALTLGEKEQLSLPGVNWSELFSGIFSRLAEILTDCLTGETATEEELQAAIDNDSPAFKLASRQATNRKIRALGKMRGTKIRERNKAAGIARESIRRRPRENRAESLRLILGE